MKEKEVVDLMKEWKSEIQKVTADYQVAVTKLDSARAEFVSSKNGFFQKNKVALYPVSIFLSILVIGVMLNYLKDCTTVKYLGVEITKGCAK